MPEQVEAIKDIILARLPGFLPPEEIKRWFEPLFWNLRGDEAVLEITAPTVFHQRRLSENYAGLLATLAAESGLTVSRLELKPRPGSGDRPAPVLVIPGIKPPAPRFTAVSGAHHWSRFLVAGSNRLAALALNDLAGEGTLKARTILLTAGGPFGKTHLLEAVTLRLAQDPRRAFLKISAADMVYQMAELARWREKEVILVDDVHLLAGQPEIQALMVQAFDAAVSRPLSLVFSAPAPPHKLTGLSESLRSRLGGGLVLAIEPPEYELLLELAARRARELELDLTPELLASLAREAGDDPRRLMGFIETAAFMTGPGRLSPAEAVGRLAPRREQTTAIELPVILENVAAGFGLKVSDLTGSSKLRQTAWPRRVAMYLARELTGLTTTEIGEAFGGRDHSTVIHALKKINEELKNPAQIKLVENIKRSIILP